MLPEAAGRGQHFQDLGHSFSRYGPPSRQITYMNATHLVRVFFSLRFSLHEFFFRHFPLQEFFFVLPLPPITFLMVSP